MRGNDRNRRTIAAQGFAAVAVMVFTHAAHAVVHPAKPAGPQLRVVHFVAR
jgi:hypothetical protein